MTQVVVKRAKGHIVSVECRGHSGYAPEGEDIVCAALSSVVQTAILGVFRVAGVNAEYRTDEEKGELFLSLGKMTERERMEIVFGIRPKLRSMNRTLQRLTKAVKYTRMGDIWREIDEGARPVADKYDIVKAAQRRWRQNGRNVRP